MEFYVATEFSPHKLDNISKQLEKEIFFKIQNNNNNKEK